MNVAARARMPAREKRVILYGVSLLLDCLGLIAGYQVALVLRDAMWLDAGGQPIIAIALPLFVMFAIAREVQSVDSLESRTLGIQRALGSLLASALIVLALSFLLKVEDISRLGFLTTFGVAALAMILGKFVLNFAFVRWMNGTATATLLLVDGLPAQALANADCVDIGAQGLWPNLDDPAMMDALSRIIAPYDRIVVSCHFERRPVWSTFLKSQDAGGEILLDRDLLHGAVAIGSFGATDTLILSQGPLSLSNRIQKRMFDIATSVAAIILLSPLLAIVAFLIKLDSPGPILFRQTRVGQGNRQFTILKFRSMRVENSDPAGAISTRPDDPRITRLGKFIRRTSIDELPQLFNVLRGDMSMVGPRPHALGSLVEDALFWEVTNKYWIRHALKPGITGLAQIRGFRGNTQSRDSLEHRLRADLEYLSTWSLTRDILILLRTLKVVMHTNAY